MLRSSPGISVTWPTRGRSAPRKDLRGREVMIAGAFQFCLFELFWLVRLFFKG